MSTTFTAEFFQKNRQKLRQSVYEDREPLPIIVTANGLLQRNADNVYPYRQDSSFWYLTGIEEPDVTLVIDGAYEYLMVPERSVSRQAFDGAVDADQLTAVSGIHTVQGDHDGWERLLARLTASKTAAVLLSAPHYIEHYGMYTNPARARLESRLREAADAIELIDIRNQIAALRMIKQPQELAAIREAISVTISGLEVVIAPARFARYQNEYELEADLTREFRLRGASGHAFSPIVAGGKRAVTLHNTSNSAALAQDTLVVLDVGAEAGHYAADITRTRAYGRPNDRQQAVFNAVLDVQHYALSLLKPGTRLKEYEEAVVEYMGQALQELNLVGSSKTADIRKYYPHAASHFLGLDVHDVGDYDRPLQAGTVLTCEPGIYIPEQGIGVRLEDDVLITDDGSEVLSAALPKTLM